MSTRKRLRSPSDESNGSTSQTLTLTTTTSCVTGRGRLRVVEGEVEVHGSAMRADQAPCQFDSPVWSSWLTLQVIGSSATVELESFDDATSAPTFRVMDQEQHDAKMRPTTIPASWKAAVDQVLQDYHAEKLSLEKQQSLNLAIHRSSLESDEEISSQDETNRPGPGFRVAICGAKGVGKSTCLRYLTNRLLSDGVERVALLDADSGQPELSPPGLLTLSLVERPLLQPPHSHTVRHYEHAVFYGSTTSQVDPHAYMECLASLVEAYQALLVIHPTLPLCINLDGWVKGLGQHILHALLGQTLGPVAHVIQLLGDNRSQQFELPSHLAKVHVAYAHNSTREESSRQPDSLIPLSIPAPELRALRLCAYFCQNHAEWDAHGIDFGQSGLSDPESFLARHLAALKPYCVPFEAVEWGFAAADLAVDIASPERMLAVLNGSIVGLCHREPGNLASHHLLPCVGLGIVRAIDREQRLFYILTPVAPELLSRANVLSRGSILLPLICHFRGVDVESFAYQSIEGGHKATVLGADPIKSRNNIQRKSLAKD